MDDQLVERISEMMSQSIRAKIQMLSSRVDGLQIEMIEIHQFIKQQPKGSSASINSNKLLQMLDSEYLKV